MALPITVPYTFGNATTAIPLSNLDSDYATVYQAVNGIGNGSVALANVAITGGTISGNTTASNVTVSSGTFTNVTLSNVTISSVSTPITAAEGGTGSSSAFTANGVAYATSTSALATGSALTWSGTALGVGASGTVSTNLTVQGTSNPNVVINSTDASASFLEVDYNTSTVKTRLQSNATTGQVGTLTNNDFTFQTNATERMRLNTSGYLGIGTSSPSDLLSLLASNSSNTTGITLTNNNGTDGIGNSITFKGSFGAPFSADNLLARISSLVTSYNGGKYGNLTFSTGSGGSISEAMCIDSSGNLLVGDTNSGYGKFTLTGSSASGGVNIWVRNTSDASGDNVKYAGIQFSVGSDDGSTAIRSYRTNSGADYSSALAFFTKGSGAGATTPTERMRIDSSGNLLVGATTSQSSFGALQVGNGSADTKILVNSVNSNFGVMQLGCSSSIECSMTFIVGVASFGEGPTSTAGDNYIFNIGAGNYGIGGNYFGVANKGYGGVLVKLAYNSTSWISVSDERMKNIQSEITNACDIIKDWRTVFYTLKSDTNNVVKVGLLAQDVQKTLPQVVDVPENETNKHDELCPLGVHYTEIIPVLVKAIQELKTLVTTQNAEIASLKQKVGI